LSRSAFLGQSRSAFLGLPLPCSPFDFAPEFIMAKLRVGIVGAAGYTGAELVRLIDLHPELELRVVLGKENAGQRLGQVLPSTEGIRGVGDLLVASFDEAHAAQVASEIDVAFTALPHAASARLGGALYDAGVQVVDLSADFRLKSQAVYEQWYGPHPRPDLLERAVYGQPEIHKSELQGARLIAAPGCYPTSAILPLTPLLKAGLVEPQPLIIDGKSGVSGGGRKPSPKFHFPEVSEGLRPYAVGGTHRHTPEMEQELGAAAGRELHVLFTPQLVPMVRGILTTAYAVGKGQVTTDQCREAALAFYDSPLVTVLPSGSLPDTLHVRGTGRAHIAYAYDARTGLVLAMCAIDNLARGASAQALQALNVARDFPADLGLPRIAAFP
jgi:N-acetyl-gamma-glutamyl-phosphate reductase